MAKRRKGKAAGAGSRPEADGVPELDFHGRPGLVAQVVHREVLAFIARCRTAGITRARVVTGKGLHSEGRPVVRPQVERTLRRLMASGEVRLFHTERLDAGGEGALRVDLEP
jgi:DNA-nicking Smr family endonuclease